MAFISQVPVQTPEAADETLGVLGNRLGEVAALRGSGADDGDGAFRSIHVLHHAGALIERG